MSPRTNEDHGIAGMLMSIPIPDDFPSSFTPWWNSVCERLGSTLFAHALLEVGSATTSEPLRGQGSIPVWSEYTSGGENFSKYRPLDIPTTDNELIIWDQTTTQNWIIGDIQDILPSGIDDQVLVHSGSAWVVKTMPTGVIEYDQALNTFTGHVGSSDDDVILWQSGAWTVGPAPSGVSLSDSNPINVSDTAAAPGNGATASRYNHKHDVTTDTITVLQAIQVDGSDNLQVKTVTLEVIDAASPSAYGTVTDWTTTNCTI